MKSSIDVINNSSESQLKEKRHRRLGAKQQHMRLMIHKENIVV